MDPDYVLTEIPEVTDLVLKNLPMQSLNRCARVCRRWRDVVQRIKRDRQQVCCLLRTGESIRDDNIFKDVMIEPQFVLVFSSFEEEFDEADAVDNVPTTPALLVALQSQLPSSCVIYHVEVESVIGTDWETGKTQECEGEEALACLLLPDTEAIRAHPLRIAEHNFTDDGLVLARLAQGMPNVQETKLVLAIFDMVLTDGESFTSPFLNGLIRCLPRDAVIAGGISQFVTPPWRCPAGITTSLGLAFTGDKLRVASCIISQGKRSHKVIRETLSALKKAEMKEDGSFAFMFACVGRGNSLHGQSNVESRIFRELFPNTPLVGFFGNGEIGHDHIFDSTGKQYHSGLQKIHDAWDISHGYTSIFVLVSWAT